MTGPAFDRVLDALRASGRPVMMEGPGRARSSCPGHDGDNKSALSVMDTADRVNLHCFTAGCESDAIVAGLGLDWRDRYHENRRENLAVYRYDDGRTVYRKRTGPKAFRQSRTEGTPTLYRLAGVLGAVAAGRPVYLTEGEEDVHALESLGLTATTAPQGATNFHLVDAEPLRGASVVAIVDRDTRGDDWADAVRAKLAGLAASVTFTRARTGKDASDHLAAGYGVADLEPYGPQVGHEVPPEPEPPAVVAEAEDTPRESSGDLFARLVADRVRALRVDRDARAVIAREGQDADPFDAGTLAALLARPAEPQARVEGLIPWAASTEVVAQRKTGKTTFNLNLARCLLTGELFLGSLAVRPVASGARVALLNFEVSGGQLARWADDAGVPVDRLFLVNLRGRRNPLAHPADRDALAALLRAQRVESLIVDPFGRAYSGTSQNDAGEVGSWLVDLDRFARGEVGALDLILTAHAGWNGERTRGSSALEDWADSIITLTRDEDTGDRFLRATGRDVDFNEDRLDFDPDTRTLRLSGTGSRKASATTRKDAETEAAIVRTLSAAPSGLSGKTLADALERKDADFTRVRESLVARGVVVKESRPGRGGGQVYRLSVAEPTEPTEKVPNAPLPNLPNLPICSGGSGSGGSDPNIPSNAGRVCADCGAPTAVNRVRCPECQRVAFGGVR